MTRQHVTRAGILSRVSDDQDATSRSVPQQTKLGRDACADNDWDLSDRHIYEDKNLSASRFTTKTRPAWKRLRNAVLADQLDVVLMWEQSRGSRKPVDWFEFLQECRDHKVNIYVVKDEELFQVSKAAHWKRLANESIDSAYESEKTSERVKRGLQGNREQGRPHGKILYGYTRRYRLDDSGNRIFEGQDIREDQAEIIREIITRVAAGDAVSTIRCDLNRRGVPARRESRYGWLDNAVRQIAMNPAYIGKVPVRAESDTPSRPKWRYDNLLPAMWPPIVEENVFWAAVAKLQDPARLNHGIRPGRAVHLLTYLARCGRCDAPMTQMLAGKARTSNLYCSKLWHVAVHEGHTDEYVTGLLLGRLEELAAAGFTTGTESAELVAARHEAADLQRILNETAAQVARGRLTAEAFGAVEADIRPKLTAALHQVRMLGVPSALHPFVGSPGIEDTWAGLSLAGKRAVIREITTEIRIHPAPVPGSPRVPGDDRITVTWRDYGAAGR